jgi:hypothetical protein
MKATCKIIVFLAVALTSARRMPAQDAQDTPASAVKVTFRMLSWDSAITDLNYAQGKKIIPVSLLPNARSPFYDYLGSPTDPLLFFREVPGPDGKPQAEVAASVQLSEFKERTLLLFFKSPTSPKEYRVQAIDDTDAGIPPGCYHFVNLTKVPLRVTCGGAAADIAAGGEQTLRGNPADGGQITGMQVDAVTASGVTHAYSNRLPFGKTTRTLVFVWQAPGTGAFELKRLAEDTAALPKPSPAHR